MKDLKTIFLAFTINSSSLADFFIGLALQLSQSYKVIIITNKEPKFDPGFNENVEVLVWPSNRPTNLKDAKFLYKQIKKYHPVMSISMFGSVNLMVLVSWLAKVPIRVTWIRTLSTQYENKKWLMERKKFMYKLSSHILVNSQATKLDTQEVYQIPEEKITVLPNSIKQYHGSFKKPTAKRHISYAGRLHESKGIETLLKAFKQCIVQYPDIHLDIIGEGPERKKLENLVGKLEIGNEVTFHSFQPKEKVIEFFKNAYMVVVPSITEAFGFVTIEGMSVKTPVIGSNTSGISEIIRHKKDGLLFEPKNTEDLFANMKLLLEDESYAKQLGEQGYDRFMSTYEHQKCIERDVEVLTHWIENKS